MNRIRAQRRANCSLFEVLHTRRQRARAQDHGQVFRRLLAHAAAADFASVANRLFNVGYFLHLVVEHNRQAVIHVRRGEVVEALAAFACEGEAHAGLAVLVATGLGVAQVFSAYG